MVGVVGERVCGAGGGWRGGGGVWDSVGGGGGSGGVWARAGGGGGVGGVQGRGSADPGKRERVCASMSFDPARFTRGSACLWHAAKTAVIMFT